MKETHNLEYKKDVRNDTATIEVDSLEFTRLALKGKNLKYEDLPAENQNLTFSFLEKKFREIASVEVFDDNILKTLSLQDGFNNAAALLSDQNDFPGIDAQNSARISAS